MPVEASIFSYLMQGGSLAILAVFFLFVWPALEKRRNESHEKATKDRNESTEKLILLLNGNAEQERKSCDDRNAALAASVEKLAAALPNICQAKCPMMDDYRNKKPKKSLET